MNQLLVALLSGIVLGFGLVVANLTDPGKVIGFLDVAGNWDPSLGVVVGCAIFTAMIGFRLAGRRGQPFFAKSFGAPRLTKPDVALVAGSALFGIGWGLGGYCPAPGVLSLLLGDIKGLIFVGGLALGMIVFALTKRKAP